MPAYAVEFQTEDGPRRGQFIIDPERKLGPQVQQVLEELRHHGTVVAGRPGDQLEVWWNGRGLDLSATPAALEIAPSRPLEVRMRPAPAAAPEAAPRPPRRPARRLTRGALAGPLTGAAGALLAWCAASGVRDLGTVIDGYHRLDLLVAALLGALAAATVAGGAALRTQGRVAPAAALGAVAGALGGAAGGAAGLALAGLLPGGAPFALRRALAWLALGAAAGTAAALPWARRDPWRLAEGAGCGALAGAAAGAVFSLAGPGDVWQALAFLLLGAGAGTGACSLAPRRAAGVLELETVAGRTVGLLRHREWELREGALVHLHAAPGRRPAARVALEAGRAWAAPGAEGAAVVVSGRAVGRPTELADGDRLEVGAVRYRYRRFAPAA